MKTARYASALLILSLLCPSVLARLRQSFSDDVVVARSELIVVGHLKKDSLVRVLYDNKPGEGENRQHRATLIITEVLKGEAGSSEIPIIIHSGLGPWVGSNVKIEGAVEEPNAVNTRLPKDAVMIMDDSTSGSMMPLVDDACQDNIWFLRRLAYPFRETDSKADFGILDPEDLRSLALKDYFLAYLSADPEAALKRQVRMSRIVVDRGGLYLDKLQFNRLAAIADPQERCKRLLAFANDDPSRWNLVLSAAGLPSCGELAGPSLEPYFNSPGSAISRMRIVSFWGRIGYDKAVPLMIGILKENDEFWPTQKLQPDWQDKYPRLEPATARMGELLTVLNALNDLADPRAKDAIEKTRTLWQSLSFKDPGIVEQCDNALDAIARKEAKANKSRDSTGRKGQ